MSPVRMEKLESSIRLVLAFNEAFNRRDVDGMMERMSADCVFENPFPAPDGTVYTGKESVTRFWQDFFRQSPQATSTSRKFSGWGCAASCAGAANGQQKMAAGDMCAAWTSSKSRTGSSARNCLTSKGSRGRFSRLNLPD